MKKKSIKWLALLFGAMALVMYSCIDDQYDLTKLSGDVTIGGDNISIPLGSTKKVFLRDLIDESEMLILDENQQYSINISEVLDPISIALDPVTIDIGSVDIEPFTIDFDFDTVSDFTLDGIETGVDLNMPDAAIGDDFDLPALAIADTHVYNLDDVVDVPGIPINETLVVVPDEATLISFEYLLMDNAEVETIHDIYFGETDQGQLINFKVNHSNINNALDGDNSQQWVRSLVIEFPPEFELDIDNDSPFAGNAAVAGNIITITNALIDNNADETIFSFFIYLMNLEESDNIDYQGFLTYDMEYEIDGFSASDVTIDSFELIMEMDEQLLLNYVDITTAIIPVDDIQQESFFITSTITGLENISTINLITFEPNSTIEINVTDPELIVPLSAGQFFLEFSETLTFDLALSDLGSSSFDPATNRLIIPAADLFDAEITLVLASMDLSSYEPVDGAITLEEPVLYYGTGMELGQRRLNSTELENLGATQTTINIPASDIVIEDAEVITSTVTSPVNEISTIEIDEEVPAELIAITSMSFDDSGPNSLLLTITFDNMPDGIEELILDNFTFTFPEFLSFAPTDNVINGVYQVSGAEAVFPPQEGFSKVFNITGFDFSEMNNGVGLLTTVVNGVTRVIIDDNNEVIIAGDVVIEDATLQMDDLTDILVIPAVTLDPYVVHEVSGTFDPEIDPVQEEISFDLDGDLDFLSGDDAFLSISNPQILFSIGNTIGAPVDLTMTLFSMDADGNMVPGSDIGDIVINVMGAETAGEATVSKFHIFAKGSPLAGYEPVHVPNLPDLLKVIPDKVSLSLTAESDKTETHHIDLSKDLEITGNFDVIIPLQFDSLNINYRDTITELSDNLKDLYDIVNEIGLTIKMTTENTIPFAFNLGILPLDAAGEQIPGVTATVEGSIAPGGLSEAGTGDVIVTLHAEDQQLELLESLLFNFHATVSETVGGAELRADQYIRFQDIQLIIEGGLHF